MFLAIGYLTVRDSSRPASKNLQGLSEEIRGILEATLKLVRGENKDFRRNKSRDGGRPFTSSKPSNFTEKLPWPLPRTTVHR